jgi:3-hydroxybutyryl-CoA dehydratase
VTQQIRDARAFKVGDELPTLTKVLTQEKIERYADASGDRNPLHIDPSFAATTQFGGPIAHGMLVLAYISEMMTAAFGPSWPQGGSLKVRFRVAARPGNRVTASGRVITTKGERVVCDVECRNGAGEALISGEASVRVT